MLLVYTIGGVIIGFCVAKLLEKKEDFEIL